MQEESGGSQGDGYQDGRNRNCKTDDFYVLVYILLCVVECLLSL